VSVNRITGNVEYRDGSTVDFETGTATLAEWELYALRHGFPPKADEAPRMLMMLVIAHAALGVEEGFETWRRTVVELEDTTELNGAGAVPPTPPVPTPGP